ncbi:hypothetical protein [Peptacetobacter hiranonis]|uniref:hypothetical protein n=1 Tax=Peptacetobacter hiranonis TaxID=89152 RepID=UPI0022E3413B|nr:hypothetical protein [Peptacetobacter hiranonis]
MELENKNTINNIESEGALNNSNNGDFIKKSTILERLIDNEYMNYMYSREWLNVEDITTTEFYNTINKTIKNYKISDKIICLNNEIINEVSSICYKKGFETALKFNREIENVINNVQGEKVINTSNNESFLSAKKELEKCKMIIEGLYFLYNKKDEVIKYFEEFEVIKEDKKGYIYLKDEISYLKKEFIKIETSLKEIEKNLYTIEN